MHGCLHFTFSCSTLITGNLACWLDVNTLPIHIIENFQLDRGNATWMNFIAPCLATALCVCQVFPSRHSHSWISHVSPDTTGDTRRASHIRSASSLQIPRLLITLCHISCCEVTAECRWEGGGGRSLTGVGSAQAGRGVTAGRVD